MLISSPPIAAEPSRRARPATAAAPVPVAAEVLVTLKPVVLLPARGSPEDAAPKVFRARTLRLVTPCLLPELHTIESISVTGVSPPAGARFSLEKATYSVGSVGAHAAVLLARTPPAMQAPAESTATQQPDAAADAWNEKRADADHFSHAVAAVDATATNSADTAPLFYASEHAAATSSPKFDATMASRTSDAHDHRFSSAKRARLNGSGTPIRGVLSAPQGDVEASLLASGFGPQTAAAAVVDTPFSSMNSSLNASLDFGEPTGGIFAGSASMLGAKKNDTTAAADAFNGSSCEADVVYHLSPSAAHALAHGVESKIPLVVFVQKTIVGRED
jgi:hypothetical protein